MKFILSFIMISLTSFLYAEDIDLTFEFDGNTRELALHLPENFEESKSYPLLIGLHGCGQDAYSYRNALSDLADENDLIVLCINALDNGQQLGKMMEGERAEVIPAAINEISKNYNILSDNVFLTGFSCNGAMTLLHGLNDLYPFKGLIPFNSYLPPKYDGSYNLDSERATCFCSGTSDGNYSRNKALYDQFKDNGGNVYFNSMEGIGHTIDFQGFTGEMQECIDFINSNVSIIETKDSGSLIIFPNPANKYFNIISQKEIKSVSIINILGETIYTDSGNLVDVADIDPGIYLVYIVTENNKITKKLILN